MKRAWGWMLVSWLASGFAYAEDPVLRQKEKELRLAAQRMEVILEKMPEPNRKGWKAYFGWASWGESLAHNKAIDAVSLEQIHSRFYNFHQGLETPEFIKTREAIENYLEAYHHLPKGSVSPHPNIHIRVKRALVEEELAKMIQVNEQIKATGNWIAGAWVTGNSHSKLTATPTLTELNGQAALRVSLKGTVLSPDSVASPTKRITVHSSAQSNVDSFAYFFLEGDELRYTQPQSHVSTSSQTTSIAAPFGLRWLVNKGVKKKTAQGNRESSQIVASEVETQFLQELKTQAEKASEVEKYKLLLHRADMVPKNLSTKLEPDAVSIAVRVPPSGAGAPLPVRPFPKDDHLEISIHESLLANVSKPALGGSWWTDVDFAHFQKELLGINTNEFLIGTDKERWSVRWDWKLPLETKIHADRLEYQFNFVDLKINGSRKTCSLTVHAKYFPVANRWGVEFQRRGEVEVRGDDSLTAEEIALLTRKFSDLLSDSLYLDGLNPPAGGGWDQLSIYETSTVSLSEGWFHATYKENPEKKAQMLSAPKKSGIMP